ncbi:hypothetical protein ABMA57_02020 [Saccharospirillum sp. HFRX-1]|uniref:hypothetical protein n=1 Tax=unclassified Saccharospirillum TaxID=2633430 RepID=UPI00371ACCA9
MPRLSANDVNSIKKLIQGWTSSKLTWELLVIACENELNIKTTRKTLLTRETITATMKVRKSELKAPSQVPIQFSDIHRANDRIARLSKRVSELEAAQEVLLDQFSRWAYNADAHGLNEDILNQPIPLLR